MTNLPAALFESTAAFYARYRSGYPGELFELLARRLDLGRDHVALDVGCGTGQVAIPLAGFVGEVVAIDPVPAMLDEARAAAETAGADNIRWVEGSSADLATLAPEGARLATFAASFHWTDRASVAGVLDTILAPGAAIVVVADALDPADDPDWAQAIEPIRAAYLGSQRRTHVGMHQPPAVPHRAVLEASPFAAVEVVELAWERQLSVDEVVGLQFSYSYSTPAMFGPDADTFAADVRHAVLELHPSGVVTEPLRVEVLVATRPH